MDDKYATMSSSFDLPDDVVAHIACRHCYFSDLPALACAALSTSLAARCAVDIMRSHDTLLFDNGDTEGTDRTDPVADPQGADLAFIRCSRMIQLWPSDDRLDIVRSMALLVLPSELDQTLAVDDDARGDEYGCLCGRAVVPVVVVMLAAAFGLPSVLVDLLGAVRPLGLAFHVGPGFCPLFFACHHGHCDTVGCLLDLGAASFDLGGDSRSIDYDHQFNPLVAAIHAEHFDVAFLLLQRCRCPCSSVDYFVSVAIDRLDDDMVWRILDGPDISVDCLIAVLQWALASRSPPQTLGNSSRCCWVFHPTERITML